VKKKIEINRDWYEKVMTPDNIKKYYLPPYSTRNDALFQIMKDSLPSEMSVFDFAAGSCDMARNFLGLNNLKKYYWNDFNRNLCKDVEQRINKIELNVAKSFDISSFNVENILEYRDFLKNCNVIIGVSMEHIKNDIEIIKEIKSGSLVGLASPNFGGESHYRFFENINDFKNRYINLIDISSEDTILIPNSQYKKFVICGRKI
jgi:hypothetical protein